MLSDKRILEEINDKNIVIDPFDFRQLGTNSYDCRLGPWYYRPSVQMDIVRFYDEESSKRYWGDPLHAKEGEIVIPGHTTILAHTIEAIGGRNKITAEMRARSSVGRSGLSVCKDAGIGDVGYISRWTMEITNHGHISVSLLVGQRVCQILFHEVGESTKSYMETGKYGMECAWQPQDMLPKMYSDWDKPDVIRGAYGL